MARILIAAALAAVTLSPGFALAKTFPVSTPEDVFSAYKAICLANPDDTAAQIATAKSAPYAMTLSREEGGDKTFENERMFAATKDEDGRRFCMVSGRLADGTSIEEPGALVDKVLPASVTRIGASENRISWADPQAKPMRIFMYMQQDRNGQLIGSFMTGTIDK